MDDLPEIAIALLTYKRTAEAVETINSTVLNLDYPQEKRTWYIGDDGSPGDHMKFLLDALHARGERILGYNTDRLRPDGHEDSYFCGRVWNKALGLCHQHSDFVLWIEDDWRLEERLDLRPFIRLLQQREDVGIVTFRVLSVGNDVHTEGFEGIHFLRYLHTTQYAYSGNPYLRHARYTKHYGHFHEQRNPGGIELEYDDRYRLDASGPDIWRPLTINQWGAWVHIGTEKAYQ